MRSGSFRPDAVQAPPAARWWTSPASCRRLSARRRFVELVQAEVGDVDITKEDVLVSVGRGIGDKENIAWPRNWPRPWAPRCPAPGRSSTPKWLDKSRQVGTSGKTVKPKVYLALGISGSFQHWAASRATPSLSPINKNPKAPIFQVANVGVVADVMEFVPELTEKIKEAK